jgi:outer membrane receptor for ferrienterochelin and colicin
MAAAFCPQPGEYRGQGSRPQRWVTTVAASANCKLTDKLLISAGVDNLFDRDFAEHLSRGGGHPERP